MEKGLLWLNKPSGTRPEAGLAAPTLWQGQVSVCRVSSVPLAPGQWPSLLPALEMAMIRACLMP